MYISRYFLSLFLAVMVLPASGMGAANNSGRVLSPAQWQALQASRQMQSQSQVTQPQSWVGKNSLWAQFYKWRQDQGISVDRTVSKAIALGNWTNYGLTMARKQNPEAFDFLSADASLPVEDLRNAYENYYGFWARSAAKVADGLAAGRQAREITQESARSITDKYASGLLFQGLRAACGAYGDRVVLAVNAVDDALELVAGGRVIGGLINLAARKTVAPILYPVLYKAMIFCTGQ